MEKYPDAEFKTYVVWFNMVPTDTRKGWKPKLLSDERAKHYWDADQAVGKWIADNVTTCEHLGPVAWDSYYLFDGDVVWGDTLEPMKSCGAPVFRVTEKFSKDLKELLKE